MMRSDMANNLYCAVTVATVPLTSARSAHPCEGDVAKWMELPDRPPRTLCMKFMHTGGSLNSDR